MAEQFSDAYWMTHALQLAEQAQLADEVPVGAVLVYDNQLVAEGRNQPISSQDPTAHAEIVALRQAAQYFKNYRLLNTTLYITLEPCVMCVGAIIHARVKRVVFGAFDPKTGAASSVFPILGTQKLNHYVEWQGGILENKCGALLKSFFQQRRAVK